MLTRVFQRAVTNLIDESASSDAHVSKRNYFPSGKMGTSAQRLCLRSGAVSKPLPVPDTKSWNEDINFGLHVNAPLRKHFVSNMCPSSLDL